MPCRLVLPDILTTQNSDLPFGSWNIIYTFCANHPLVRVRACVNFWLARCVCLCAALNAATRKNVIMLAKRRRQELSKLLASTHTHMYVCVCVFRPFKIYRRLFLASLKMPSKYVGQKPKQSKAKRCEEERLKETLTILTGTMNEFSAEAWHIKCTP